MFEKGMTVVIIPGVREKRAFPLWSARCVFAALLLFGCLLLCSCGEDHEEQTVVHLNKLQKLPTEEQVVPPALRLAVAAIISPEGTIQSYRPLVDYLSARLGAPVQLVQRRTYWEVNEMIARRQVDVAFVCTGAYLQQGEQRIMSLLVVPQVHGKNTYRAAVIVRADSPIASFQGFRGKVFAFTDPLSNTGYLYPVTLLKAMGTTPDRFFKRTIFTYSHDRSIEAVLDGVVQGASVDEIVLQHAQEKDPSLASRIKVILRSPEFGMPPVVVPVGTPEEKKARLRRLFLEMDRDPAGQKALAKLGIDRFVAPDPHMYKMGCPPEQCPTFKR